MRTLLPLLALLAACGDSGLLLDINPASKDVKSVEVFIAKDQDGDYMGMPPANSQQSTQGPVYEIVDKVATPIDGDGRVRVLLQPGAVDQVPALLVLGYNANHEAITYAIVQNPNGPIVLRHTQSDQIVVTLDPAKSTSVGSARMPAGSTPRIVRWSADKAGDDLAGPCIGVIEDDTQGVKGTFFGPPDDLDCDNAMPECDDNWYLKTEGAGHCVTDMIATTDPLNGACRLGTTAGCIDNDPNSAACTPTNEVVCGPSSFCDQCSNRTLEMSGCLGNTAMNDATPRIECMVWVADNGAGGTQMCANETTSLDMGVLGLFGQAWRCDGIAGFTSSYLDAANPTPLNALPLEGATNVALGFQCHADTSVLGFGVSAPPDTPVADAQQETWAGMVIGVHQLQTTGTNRFLVLPIHVTYAVAPCPSDPTTQTLDCGFYAGNTGGAVNADTLWNCSGTGR